MRAAETAVDPESSDDTGRKIAVADPLVRFAQPHVARVYAAMGYIIAVVVLLLLIPLLFMVLSRRTTGPGGVAARHRDRGMTVEKPMDEGDAGKGRNPGD
jgi:hypothetical protein